MPPARRFPKEAAVTYNIRTCRKQTGKQKVSTAVPRVVLLMLCLANAWVQVHADTLDFSAQPTLGPDESRTLYDPLMELLSRDTGHTFRYIHSDSWFAYQSGMRHGRFDLLLDDAHFASWRIASLGDALLARVREQVRFVVIATKAQRVYSTEDLVARTLCAYPQPDLGTISILRKFDSPFQVPQVVETHIPLDRVRRLLAGDCAGAVLTRHQYYGSDEIRSVASRLKIITQSDSYPGLTLTASRDVPEDLREAIQRILLSRAGGWATRELRDRIASGSSFIEANAEEYKGLDALLREYPGFNP